MAGHMAELLAFTAENVRRLTGLTLRQIRYWDKTGFFRPAFIANSRSFGRVYSFRDVVGLRTIATLRGRAPLQELRRVGAWLKREHETPWSSLKFGLHGRKVVFFDPASGVPREASGDGQVVFSVTLEVIASEMSAAAAKLRERVPEEFGQIVRNRYVAHNAPVVAGTRVRTGAIWNYHSAGYQDAEILREYPSLTDRDVKAAIAFERQRRAA